MCKNSYLKLYKTLVNPWSNAAVSQGDGTTDRRGMEAAGKRP